jgi:hypothetical protein
MMQTLIPVTETRFCMVDTHAFARTGDEVALFVGVCDLLADFDATTRDLLGVEHGQSSEDWYWTVRETHSGTVTRTGRCETKFVAVDELLSYLSDIERVRQDHDDVVDANDASDADQDNPLL